MRPQVVAEFGEKARYFNTFGGNPVAAAAGMAVLDVIKADNLQNNARDVGAFMQDEFRQLAAEFAVIGDVRGAGLFIGVEIVSDAKSKT
ncbi:aminotransferase class III-fold pyridoxal phosphate-dependent enzyme, partial [Acinetobacter baumannii]